VSAPRAASAPAPAPRPGPTPPSPPADTRSVARNALYLALGQAATTTLAIVLTAALGRFLGAADFGTYYVLITMSTSAYLLLEWGQSLWVVRETARAPERAGELLGTALACRVGLVAVATVPVGVLTLALGYGVRTTGLFVLLFLANVPLFLAQGFGIAFRAAERMGRDAVVSVSNKVLVLAVALPALVLGAGIPGVILAQAVAGGVAIVTARLLYVGMHAPPLRWSRPTARALFLGGLPVLSISLTGAAQPYLEAVILSKLAPAAAVGYFGAARNILGTLVAPAVIMGTASYPRIARAAHHPAALPGEVQTALRPLLWLGALGATGTFLFAETAVGLIYGSSFAPAATILKVYAGALFLVFIDILLGNVLYASGAAVGFAAVLVVKVLVSAGLSVVFVPALQARTGNGGLGIVLAFLLSEFLVLAGALVLLPRGTLTRAAAGDTARAVGAAGLTVLLCWCLPVRTPWLGIPLCIGTFIGASWLLGLLHRRDVDTLTSLFRKPQGGAVYPLDPPS
jgi:O-antigen/teichoic acid export membrane protein